MEQRRRPASAMGGRASPALGQSRDAGVLRASLATRPASAVDFAPRVAGVGASGRLTAQLGGRPRTAVGSNTAPDPPAAAAPGLRASPQRPQNREVQEKVLGSDSERGALASYLDQRDSLLGPPTSATDADFWRAMMMGDHRPKSAAGRLAGKGDSQADVGLPSFEAWQKDTRAAEKQAMHAASQTKASIGRRSFIDDKYSSLRQQPAQARPEALSMAETVDRLSELEQRVRTLLDAQQKVEGGDTEAVAVEVLLGEMQAYDILFQAALRHAELACPAVGAVVRALWDSFVAISSGTLSEELRQALRLQGELRHANDELLHAQRQLSKLQLEHRKTESTLAKKAAELTKAVQDLLETRRDNEKLRQRLQQGGVDANFDPLRIAGTVAVLEEAEACSKRSGAILREIGVLMAAQEVDEEELKAYVDEVAEAIPAKYRRELEKLMEVNEKLRQELRRGHGEAVQSGDMVLRLAGALQANKKKKGLVVLTPRPDWNALLTAVCPQLADKEIPTLVEDAEAVTFKDADYQGGTRDRVAIVCGLVGRLLPSGLGVKPEVSKDEFFEPLGIEKPVPAFLRSKVPIRNRNISKRDTEMLIRSIWSARAEYIRSEAKQKVVPQAPLSFHEHIFKVLRLKVGNFQNMISEVGMNLMEGCRRYLDDADVEMFKMVVEGKVGEEVVNDQEKVVGSLLHAMRQADSDSNSGKFTETLSLVQLEEVVHAHFPVKGKMRIAAMIESVNEEHPTGNGRQRILPVKTWGGKVTVKYELLYKEDINFDQGPFLEAVRDQYLQERTEFLIEVERQLQVLHRVKEEEENRLFVAANTGGWKQREKAPKGNAPGGPGGPTNAATGGAAAPPGGTHGRRGGWTLQVLVTPDEGLEALRLTDPCAPVSELHRLWRIGFGLTNGLPDGASLPPA